MPPPVRPIGAAPPGSPPGTEPATDEEALLRRLRAGDRKAFAVLVERHAGALLRLARTMVRDASDAEELVQDTWVAALDGLDRFEGRAAVRTWLFKILVNKARTRLARGGRTVPFSALAAGESEEQGADLDRFDAAGAWKDLPGTWSEENPERLAQGAETRAAIEAAMAALPEAQRAVLTLRDVEGLETDEICNLLGITVTNQRVLLHRARARVREALERHLGGSVP